MVNVYLIEDSPLMQSTLGDLLDLVGGFRVVGAAAGEMQATEWLHDNPGAWDLVTIDLTLLEGSGFNLIGRFKAAAPDAAVAVLSDFVTPAVAERCLQLGADAAFSKHEVGAFSAWLAGLQHAESDERGGR